MTLDRYQSGLGEQGTMPTEAWFAALLAGVDAPLGAVLDVGAAEGVMCVLALSAGATHVTGIELHDERMVAALALVREYPAIDIREQRAQEFSGEYDTVVFSMMAHWLGANETHRFARMARKYFLVVFREANDHYAVPENGTWFPTLEEMDATVGGIRTHEEVVLEQDHGKRTWAVTYRTDMEVRDGLVLKHGRRAQLYIDGRDLHGDAPFRPTHGAPLATLSPEDQEKVRRLAFFVASKALDQGWYPTDFSPRNVLIDQYGAWLTEDQEDERAPGTIVAPEYLPIWRRTLSTVGIDFDGDLASLL